MSKWMFEFSPEGAFEPRPGGGMRLHGGKGGSSAPPPDPRLIEGQLKSMGIQDSAIQQIMANQAEMAPLQKEQTQFGLDAQKKAYEQSQEDRTWMLGRRGQLSGMQDQMISDAKEFNTEEKQAELAGKAGADVQQSFANVEDQNVRALQRQGVDPNSGRALAMRGTMDIAKASALAGGVNNARTNARTEGRAMTDRAGNALAGYPAMSMQATGAGAGYGANGLTVANTGLTGLNSGSVAAGGMAGQMGANAAQMYGTMGTYKNNSDRIANDDGGFMGALGTLGGAAIAKMPWSDRRLKTNIVKVGVDERTGLNLYEFNYKADPRIKYRGVMADEVEAYNKDAVIWLDGFASVDYAMLGIEFVEV